MAATKIEWSVHSWNPVTGCTKISSGCKFCYAEGIARRLQETGQEKYRNGFALTLHSGCLKEPYVWKKPRMIFMCSMGDLFHKDVPVSFIQKVFNVVRDNPHHVFQVLTKRSGLLMNYDRERHLSWPHNLWMGVTVEDRHALYRIGNLRNTGARVKFLSCEPLLGPLHEMDLEGIDWVIVGGESGLTPRPVKKEWVTGIRDQCKRSGVAFYFKQWGGTDKKKNGRVLEGKIHEEVPAPVPPFTV